MRATAVFLARSAWKGPQFTAFPGMQQAQKTGAPIMTQARSCTVLPAFVGLKLLVHNGKQYVPVNVTSEMVGHKLGELVPTKKTWSFRQTRAGK